MTCTAFRDRLMLAVRNGFQHFRLDDSQREHISRCGRCQVLVLSEDVATPLLRAVANEPLTPLDELIAQRVRRKIRVRVLRKRILAATCAAGVVVATIFGFAHLPETVGPSTTSATENTATKRKPLAHEIGESHAWADFPFRSATVFDFDKSVTLVYSRRRLEANHYEFAKRVALAANEQVFPEAPHLIVSIEEEGKCILQLLIRPEQVHPERLPRLAKLSGHEFCQEFALYDRDAKVREQEGE